MSGTNEQPLGSQFESMWPLFRNLALRISDEREAESSGSVHIVTVDRDSGVGDGLLCRQAIFKHSRIFQEVWHSITTLTSGI